MTTIVFPALTVKPSRIEWQLLSSSLGVQSPLDLSIQQQEFIGARWGMILEYNTFTEGDANALKAFLVKMRGGANVVELYNFERPKPQGVTIGAPTIKVVGAGQTGNTLNTNGWATGSHVKAGDFFSVNGELKMIVTDAAESANSLTVEFEPPLRASPPDDAPLDFTQPTTTMKLTEDVARWSPVNMGKIHRAHDFVLQFVEVWR